MSTVRMSEYLRRDITKAFENSYDKAHPPLIVKTKWGDKIYNTYIGSNVKHLLATAETAFGDLFDVKTMFSKEAQLQAIAPITIAKVSWDSTAKKYYIETSLREEFHFTIYLSTERIVPRALRNNWAQDVIFKFNRYEDKTVDYVCQAIEYNSKVDAKKKLTSREVNDLLLKFTTLNQAIKAWPALSKLVEPEKLAKIHEKQQRKRNQELQKEMTDKVVINNDLNKTILTGALLGDDD